MDGNGWVNSTSFNIGNKVVVVFFSSSPTLNDDYKLIFLFCYRIGICVPCLIIIIVIVIILLSIQLFQCFPITNQIKRTKRTNRIEVEMERKKERKNEKKAPHHAGSETVKHDIDSILATTPIYAHELFNANCIRHTHTHTGILCVVCYAVPLCPMWFCIVEGRPTISMEIRQ